MFNKLRNKIIIITMSVTTVVLVLSGVLIMVFSSAARPEPKPRLELDYGTSNVAIYDSQELENYIWDDRREGSERLLITLVCVGGIIEIIVFLIVYYASQKIVEPVEDSYEKQKMFIANASHELKTPLAVIQANMEAIEVDKENEKWKRNIENEIGHASKLVLDLLQLAKMDAGSVGRAKPEKMELDAEIRKRVEMFVPKFAGKISYRCVAKSKSAVLPKRDMLQVLDILLDNATKYGEKKISVILDEGKITVSNDGAVVAKEDLVKVFDRFYQSDKTKEGSGLGLAIAKALCEQNGWEIRCERVRRATKFGVVFG